MQSITENRPAAVILARHLHCVGECNGPTGSVSAVQSATWTWASAGAERRLDTSQESPIQHLSLKKDKNRLKNFESANHKKMKVFSSISNSVRKTNSSNGVKYSLQSINQSINRAIEQSNNQSINQSIEQSNNQSINRLFGRTAKLDCRSQFHPEVFHQMSLIQKSEGNSIDGLLQKNLENRRK